ncbi:beta-glucuronidase [Tetranychus urticae]|uniref:Beta-glucuronidase n=1 Tax=Tetranychus urticae TaxID=32264 RepID=T1L0Y1_TETUR|nr:beta-glucuronidase [Tetranychus urticae]
MNLQFLFIIFCVSCVQSSLYPKDSLTRFTRSLDGIWNFRISPIDDQNVGFKEKWFASPLSQTGSVIPMPVPSSFNDITQEKSIRDFIGWAWYDTEFYVDPSWLNSNRQVILRFSSVNYAAKVYVNGVNVTEHIGGHLPFEVLVKENLISTGVNRLTVAVNNTLDEHTVPPGQLVWKNGTDYPKNFYVFTPNFDFFNYAGIHRSVHLYSVPSTFIKKVKLASDLIYENSSGVINYALSVNLDESASQSDYKVDLVIKDAEDKVIALYVGDYSGSVTIPEVNAWWPYLMNPKPAYLYKVVFEISKDSQLVDQYEFKIGFRKVEITEKQFLINGKPFYFTGFGRHEDSNIRGRGLDQVLNVKDFNLIRWIGANSFRTSHYPYSEEMMDLADSQGIVVVDECPAVGLESFDNIKLNLHRQFLTELIDRDYHRPSVVMWSIANEPSSTLSSADNYFKTISSHVKKLDTSRPVTAAVSVQLSGDLMSQYLDVIMINRYFAWYSDYGEVEVIKPHLVNELRRWYKKFKRPILISEYGTDTIPGIHASPSYMFSEDYQTECLMEWFDGFDQLRADGFFVGEMIWNFADFMTAQGTTRVYGNRKGIFTRERQPKAAAKLLRCRYFNIHNASVIDHNMYCPAR